MPPWGRCRPGCGRPAAGISRSCNDLAVVASGCGPIRNRPSGSGCALLRGLCHARKRHQRAVPFDDGRQCPTGDGSHQQRASLSQCLAVRKRLHRLYLDRRRDLDADSGFNGEAHQSLGHVAGRAGGHVPQRRRALRGEVSIRCGGLSHQLVVTYQNPHGIQGVSPLARRSGDLWDPMHSPWLDCLGRVRARTPTRVSRSGY